MLQSEVSPFSIDITTCLKFERKRVVFEHYIIELCGICESFWHELNLADQEYNVDKVHAYTLSISKVII